MRKIMPPPSAFKLSLQKKDFSKNAEFYNPLVHFFPFLIHCWLNYEKQSDGRNPIAGLRGLKTPMKLTGILPGRSLRALICYLWSSVLHVGAYQDAIAGTLPLKTEKCGNLSLKQFSGLYFFSSLRSTLHSSVYTLSFILPNLIFYSCW